MRPTHTTHTRLKEGATVGLRLSVTVPVSAQVAELERLYDQIVEEHEATRASGGGGDDDDEWALSDDERDDDTGAYRAEAPDWLASRSRSRITWSCWAARSTSSSRSRSSSTGCTGGTRSRSVVSATRRRR